MASLTVIRTHSPSTPPARPVTDALRVSAILTAMALTATATLLAYRVVLDARMSATWNRRHQAVHLALGADALAHQANDRYQMLLSALARRATDAVSGKAMIAPENLQSLWQFKNLEGLPIERVYVLDAHGGLLFPSAMRPSSTAQPREPKWGALEEDVRRAQTLAETPSREHEALQSFEALLQRATDRDQRIELIKAIAGLYGRLGNVRYAETLYRKLIQTEDQTLDASGVPVGVSARKALAALYESAGEINGAAAVRLELARGGLERRWALPSSEAQAFFEDAAVSMAPLSPAPPPLANRWNEIQHERFRLISAAAATDAFYYDRWPELLSRLRDGGWLETGHLLRTPSSGHTFVIVPWQGARQQRGFMVAEVSSAVLESDQRVTLLPLSRLWRLDARFSADARGTPVQRRRVSRIDPPQVISVFPENPTPAARHALKNVLWALAAVVAVGFVAGRLKWKRPRREIRAARPAAQRKEIILEVV